MASLHSILTRIVYNIYKNFLVTQLLVKKFISVRLPSVGNKKRLDNKHSRGSRMG